ncbi:MULTISPECIES: glycosyltransferase family 4 protein [unclassified Proteiniphilum]|jgi:glycosyltransferase involved in cell wall biosynthesis|uniref:glycosyltransferase family 4 protein n=1 Tax=Proteiniphilum sp. UBA5310 TaxID=1947275 RepID=UPI00257A347B|nr:MULTISPECIES: glycosyltransferase family 4 protein [unclassified Proteiniphilum]
MKILLLDNSSLTPVNDDYCIDAKTGIFAKELQSLGNEITMYGQKVIAENTSHTYQLLKNRMKVVGLKRKKNKLLNYILLYLRIIPLIIKQNFVYIFYPSSYKFVAMLCWIFRKKYGIYIRGEQGIKDKSSHWIYKNAFVVFTVTDGFTNFVSNVTGKHNAYTIRPMIPFTDRDVVTNREYRKGDIFKILYLGRVEADKGMVELIQAASKLREKEYNYELTIVGNGGFMPDIRALIRELNLDESVRLIGGVDDSDRIAEYYKTSDVYILPTYHEGFPRTLYEAMIFGTPIITTFVGGIPGIMKDGYNCKEIKPKSVDSIIEGLKFALMHYNLMIEYSKNATNTVFSILDPQRPSHAEHLNKFLKIS